MLKLITPLAVATLTLAFTAPEAAAQFRLPAAPSHAAWGRPYCPPRPWCPPQYPQPGCYPAPKFPRPYDQPHSWYPPRPWRQGGFPRHGHH